MEAPHVHLAPTLSSPFCSQADSTQATMIQHQMCQLSLQREFVQLQKLKRYEYESFRVCVVHYSVLHTPPIYNFLDTGIFTI